MDTNQRLIDSITYRQAFIVLCCLQLVYFLPVLVRGHVISPHPNDVELQVRPDDDALRWNRKFSDYSSWYIPEIHHHLDGDNKAWLATWVPNVQLGRPAIQRWHGKSNFITHGLSLITQDPFVLYSLLTVSNVFLLGVFTFLFLRALDLHPLACLVAAIGLSTGTFVSYWLTFTQFIAVRTWEMGLLWAITAFIKRRSIALWGVMVFCTYNLIMMGRLQAVIRSAYLIVGFALIYLILSRQGARAKLGTVVLLGGAAVLGAVMTLPNTIDLIARVSNTPRFTSLPDSYFTAVLAQYDSPQTLGRYLHLLIDPFWYGNPIEPAYPFVYNGMSLTPFYAVLLCLSLVDNLWRRTWPWLLLLVFLLAAQLWPPIYLVMVNHLGFHFSRSQPIGGALLPAFIVAGYTLDHILRRGVRQPVLPVIALILGFLIVIGLSWRGELHVPYILASVMIILGTYAFMKTRHLALLAMLVVGSLWLYGFGLQLTRPPSQIHVTSPLVEAIQAATPNGERFAWVDADVTRLPPNQHILLDLHTVHSIDSSASLRYQNFAGTFSDQIARTFGAQFTVIPAPDSITESAFSYMGIAVILSERVLDIEGWSMKQQMGRYYFHEAATAPILFAQIADFAQTEDGAALSGSLVSHDRLPLDRSQHLNDYQHFATTNHDAPTLLFVSQQYHPWWLASSAGVPLDTMPVNGFYQGVMVPPGTTEVTLQFKPFSLWSWVPQLGFLIAGVLFALRGLLALAVPENPASHSSGSVQ